MTKLTDIVGIGPAYAEKLKSAGIKTIESLLKQGATPVGRKSLAEKSGISDRLILEWVNRADLFRVEGIGEEYTKISKISDPTGSGRGRPGGSQTSGPTGPGQPRPGG